MNIEINTLMNLNDAVKTGATEFILDKNQRSITAMMGDKLVSLIPMYVTDTFEAVEKFVENRETQIKLEYLKTL